MRAVLAGIAIVLACACATSAQARTQRLSHHHHRHTSHRHHHALHHRSHHQYHHRHRSHTQTRHVLHYSSHAYAWHHHHRRHRTASGRLHYGQSGRPAAWCGWYMRRLVGRDPGPAYNRAREWAHYGSDAGSPKVGTIVVWRHHVGQIVGRAENGRWIVRSGNDGHAVRTRARSLAGALAFRTAYASY